MPDVGLAAVLGIEFQEELAELRGRRRVFNRSSPAATEGLLSGIVEMALVAKEQHFVPSQRVVQCRHCGIVQLIAEPHLANFAADATRHREDV